MSNFKRIDLYLGSDGLKSYVNTDTEQQLVAKFHQLFTQAKAAQEKRWEASPDNLNRWRKAYLGVLDALTIDGNVSDRKSRQLRKLCYEIVESKVDNSVPMPKMNARYKSDLFLVDRTENYLKFEVDRVMTKYYNDQSERSTYIDGTSWYKVGWNSMNSTHERSGDICIDIRSVDEVYPQPGIKDYKQLEYIFEKSQISVSKLYDLYGRKISPTDSDNVPVISCYYLNNNGIVGLFMYAEHSMQVICNEENWQIRKLRKCKVCGTVNPTDVTCRNCGNDTFKYEVADEDILTEDLMEIYNPYDAGETDDESLKDKSEARVFATVGTKVPFYVVRQLPFVPRPAISSVGTLYGISEVFTNFEMQDAINKILTKAVDKTLKSGAVLTKPEKRKISDTDDTFKVLDVKSAEEAQQIQCKQIVADTTGDIMLSNLIYDSSKSSSGITDSFQGKKDTTATSGKAKQYAAAQSAGRIESLRVMKSTAFAGLYELIFKYLLAFSDEKRRFVKTLPDGTQEEMVWNKYMFLQKDAYGKIYYRDDFTFGTDVSSTLTQNREAMWQETQNKFIQGAFGNPADPRALKLFWNTMDMLQYPLAKIALAGIKDSEQHLPPELEAAIMSNPEIMKTISQILSEGQSGQGGARIGAGQKGNGATHSANVERTNERNRAKNKQTITPNQQGGSI